MNQSLLFYDGEIITMTAAKPRAVLVENGKIAALGDFSALSALSPQAEPVSLHGAALLPAFLDAHSHFTQVAYSLLQVSLAEVTTEEALIAAIQQETPRPGQWIIARDFDHNRLPGARRPALAVLDAAAPNNPLVIQHQSGHMGFFNTPGLQALGITPQTTPPPGGRIEVADGRLTGYVEENAFFELLKRLPAPGEAELMAAYQKAQTLYASHGITTVQEGMLVEEMLPLYQLLLRREMLQLDLVAYAGVDSLDVVKKALPEHLAGYRGHLKLGGLKIFLDGSPQGRTAWLRENYVDGDCGYGTMTDSQVEAAFVRAAREGMQLLAHCNGDAAIDQFLRCLERTEAEYPVLRRLRPVIIHGQIMDLDQVEKAKALGAMVSYFVAHVYHWGDTHIRNLGMARASRISPAADALRVGLPMTFHQDSPVIPPDMFETLWCAANRVTRDGVVLGSEQRISVHDALAAVTTTAAWQYGEEGRKGAIAPGMEADLVVADRNPLATAPLALRECRVLKTYKAGQLVFES